MKTELDEFTFYYLVIDAVVYKDRELFIFLDQSAVSVEQEDIEIGGKKAIEKVRQLEVMDDSLGFVVHFSDVLLYQVIDECADLSESDVIESEGNISKFKSSSLLNYAKTETILFDVTPSKIEHYRVMTGDEWIHVLCRGAPVVMQKSEWQYQNA